MVFRLSTIKSMFYRLSTNKIKVLRFGLFLGVVITEKPRFFFKKLLMDSCYCFIIRYYCAIIPSWTDISALHYNKFLFSLSKEIAWNWSMQLFPNSWNNYCIFAMVSSCFWSIRTFSTMNYISIIAILLYSHHVTIIETFNREKVI